MSEARAARYAAYSRQARYENTKRGYIKRTIAKQALICGFFLAAVIFAKDNFLPEESVALNAVCFILNETTDFQGKWQEIKGFLGEQIKMTGLLNADEDFDPVRSMKSPATGEVYQKFGIKKDEKTGTEEFCYGVKIKQDMGAKISCAEEGEVAETGAHADYGNYILIKHSEKIYTFYAYLNEVLPSAGERVEKGQLLGTAGMDPKEGSAMLYFEIRDGESTLDPEAFIDFGGGEKK